MPKIQGLWLPIITPFINDQIDWESYRKLIDYYIGKGISGLMPLGTTGESPTVSEYELEQIVEKTIEYVGGRVPIYVGMGGNHTAKLETQLKKLERFGIDGVLSVSPYYNRPDQRGIYQHFLRVSEATRLNIVVYNIPYRTGRNIENETIRRLAELKNIVGLKDACGDIKQTAELLLNKPDDFSILCGEDILYYTMLTLGSDGGIMASAHLRTEEFLKIYELMRENDFQSALKIWGGGLSKLIPLLFAEPSPGPIKYVLKQKGLIHSLETRLPILEVTEELKSKLASDI
ncbi:MAG TPA: 4-hydroxy-tetrahydrodipicolinate synthase [Bacillota bacterium]|nr:4-hydroxy-tetrahydrodipicolinate synthase [Bacillota bacterium]